MDQLNNLMQNPYFSAALTLFLVLYGALARPDLPDYVMNLFENPFFRVLVLVLIAFTATKNLQVALISAVVFTLTMNLVSERKMAEGFMAYQ